MADIDAELLALAGDASSDEEDAPMNISRESSASRDVTAKANGKKSNGRKSGRRGNKDDSEEEGEASSGSDSVNSLHSAAMDESDSDSDAGPANMYDQGDLFPLEGKFKDSADKAEIMAMPEIKREELLADRAQQMERDRQNRALRQLLHARKAGQNKNKRKAGKVDLDDDTRKTSRQRTKVGGGKFGEASSGIDNLKRARAEKTDRQRRRQEDKDRYGDHRGNGRGEYSDGHASGESEVEWDEGKHKTRASPSPPPKDAPLADLRDIERVRTGRSQFALVCFYPGFNEAITGCFVRISVGPHPESGENVYRMAVIKGFTEGKPYAIEAANGKPIVTTQYIRAAHGKLEKEWPFVSCSNSRFTEAEFNRYTQTCLIEGVPLPTKPKLSAKISDINALVNRSWTEAELQEKLKRSGALKNKYIPIERNRINNMLKEAKASGDLERIEQLRAELQALEGPKLAFGTSLRGTPKKTGPKELTQQERLAILNKENRRKNAEEVRQAQIKERRAVMATEAALARGETVLEDHSRRVKTKAKFKHDASAPLGRKSETASGTSTPAATGTPKVAAKTDSTPLPHIALLEKMRSENKGLPTIRRPLCDDEIIGAIDLGIEIEL
ncbi:MAG: hypothetical protein M1818_004462 [Claussenomyces sp. TS43310]|nr:MAG: hypothetical protein M1818_004462 [Claussenomyces sp. TS43310]